MQKIWNDFSFRQRLLPPITLMILSALVSGAMALLVFSPDQFEYENEQELAPHARSREPSMEPLKLRAIRSRRWTPLATGSGIPRRSDTFRREQMNQCHLCAGRKAACPPGSPPISPFPTSKRLPHQHRPSTSRRYRLCSRSLCRHQGRVGRLRGYPIDGLAADAVGRVRLASHRRKGSHRSDGATWRRPRPDA